MEEQRTGQVQDMDQEKLNASSLIRTYHPLSLKSPYDKFQIADIGDCPVNPADLQDSLNKVSNFYNSIVESNTIHFL